MRIGVMLMTIAVAFGTLRDSARAFADQAATANYVYEIWYEIERDSGPQFDLYLGKLKDATRHIPGSPERWVDANHENNTRLVSLPAARLADFGSERYNEAGLKVMMGDHAYEELTKIYTDAQIARRSYIRQYRTDLSLNRQHRTREGIWATEYTLVTIESGKEKQFERLWRTALRAYARVSPHAILVGAYTLVGGGPQYIVIRPLKTPGDRDSLPSPARAVELASGPSEARAFASALKQSVNKWETLVLEKTDLDAVPARSARHAGL